MDCIIIMVHNQSVKSVTKITDHDLAPQRLVEMAESELQRNLGRDELESLGNLNELYVGVDHDNEYTWSIHFI